jgi:hypothetical protein
MVIPLHPNPGALRAIICRGGALCRRVVGGNPIVSGITAHIVMEQVDKASDCGPHRLILYHAVGVHTGSRYDMDVPLKPWIEHHPSCRCGTDVDCDCGLDAALGFRFRKTI